MKIYVVCDLEGTAEVVDFMKQCTEEGKYYRQAIRMATLELNALIDGTLDGRPALHHEGSVHGGKGTRPL